MELNQDELSRYSRHLSLPEVGLSGQIKIRQARILCVGAGGLGSPAALYLGAAGVGTLGIIDSDKVEASNLQRQVLHGTSTLGVSKPASAKARLHDLNPHVQTECYEARLSVDNAMEIASKYDVVLDGSDNFATRYLVNDACVLLRKPCVYGAVFRFEGQVSVLAPHLGAPCYRCLFPEPPPPEGAPSCAEAGVLGVVPGIIGLMQATEALKLVLGLGQGLLKRLILFDALQMKFREIAVKPDSDCAICGRNKRITKLSREFIPNEIQCNTMHPDEVSVQDLKNALDNPKLGIKVLDVREPDEYQIAHIKGATLFPLSTLQAKYKELDHNQAYYLHCKGGGRSMKAVEFLRSKGFNHLKSVEGGILKWSEQIDPSVPRY